MGFSEGILDYQTLNWTAPAVQDGPVSMLMIMLRGLMSSDVGTIYAALGKPIPTNRERASRSHRVRAGTAGLVT